jgi:hypothetical protein
MVVEAAQVFKTLIAQVFIVLKKNNSQLSFLHCYHHGLMVLGTFLGMWVPGGSIVMLGITNAIIHSFMYSYYLMVIIQPALKKSVWLKRQLTNMQLIQFVFLVVHFARVVLAENCGFSKGVALAILIQNVCMLALFGDYYLKMYLKPKTN